MALPTISGFNKLNAETPGWMDGTVPDPEPLGELRIQVFLAKPGNFQLLD